MARRLRVLKKKNRRDLATAYAKGEAAPPHKVAVERSRKACRKKAFRPS